KLFARYHGAGHRLVGAGIVVGSLIDPAQLANNHMRIHALEGQLFRQVVVGAAAAHRLALQLYRERDLYNLAESRLGLTAEGIRQEVGALGKTVSGPWRTEQKAARIAGWMVLAGGGFDGPRQPDRA